MLTPGQIAHFETFGFLVLREQFSAAELSSIRSEFDAVWSEASGGQPWSGETTESRQPFCEIRPPLTKLVEDNRIYGAAEQLLGPNFIWGASGATRYVGDSGWHADDYDGLLETYRAIKVVMYLEPVEKDTGCLRIIPGSHHRSFYRELRPIDQQHSDLSRMPFSVPGRDTPGYPMETQPADLLIFDTRAYHGAFGGEPGRSNIQMVYFPDPATDEEVETLRQIHDQTQYHLRVPESFLNSDRSRIRGMVSRLVELGFESTKV
jgi:ectoine hydroxylase-related dioxygenase (phytanoyl-CoA dioxygenase family)